MAMLAQDFLFDADSLQEVLWDVQPSAAGYGVPVPFGESILISCGYV